MSGWYVVQRKPGKREDVKTERVSGPHADRETAKKYAAEHKKAVPSDYKVGVVLKK